MKPKKKEAPATASNPGTSADKTHLDPAVIRWLTLTVFFAVLLLNLLLLTKNYYWDGIFFAQAIEDAPKVNASLIHPSHLLDLPFVWFIYREIRWAGLSPRALTVFQLTNCVFSAAAASVLLRICIDYFKSIYVALVLTALFAFSATWWKFSTDADAYILPVLLLLFCLWLMLRQKKPRPLALAVLHALAILLHQLAVFFFPVAVVGLLLQRRSDRHETPRKNVVKYAVIVVGITLGVYFYTFHLVTGAWSIARFVSWATYFSPENGFTFSIWNNLIYSLRSQWRVVFGGRIAFVRDLWGPAILALTFLTLSALAAFAFVLVRHFADLRASISASRQSRLRFKPLIIISLVWIASYVLFLFFFIPQNTFYRLFYLPAIIMLAGTFLAGAETAPNHRRRYRAALFAAVMFLANLTFSQFPYTQVRANPPLELALKLNQNWLPGTVVYFALPNSDGNLVKYFNPATIWIEANPQTLNEKISQLPPGRAAWLETTLIDELQKTPEGRTWLTLHASHRPESELVNRKFRIEFWQLRRESFINP